MCCKSLRHLMTLSLTLGATFQIKPVLTNTSEPIKATTNDDVFKLQETTMRYNSRLLLLTMATVTAGLTCTRRNCNQCDHLVTVKPSAPICQRLLQKRCCESYIHDTQSLWPVKQNDSNSESKVLHRVDCRRTALFSAFIMSALLIAFCICYHRNKRSIVIRS